jgi:phosphosulfolactate synthase
MPPATPTSGLDLPARVSKPRAYGLTMMIDNGLPPGYFADIVDSAPELIDLVKFGWGTSIVTTTLDRKIACLRRAGIPYSFGGTLFEKFAAQGRFEDYLQWCHSWDCPYVEISDGTIEMSAADRAHYVSRAAQDFIVVSEVGFKDAVRSEALTADEWIERIRLDLDAGARWVITEARESGKSGICRPDGTLKVDLIEDILLSGTDPDRLIFEAPGKDLQAYLVKRLGPNVNLGNIAPSDLIGLETIRLGLRSDTFLHFEGQRHVVNA